MKRLIFLKVEYLDLKGKKTLKADVQKMHQQLCDNSLREFKLEMQSWIKDKSIKVLKEFSDPDPQVLIQFDEKRLEEVMQKLISIQLVDIIDSIIPSGLDS
jgi:hypothetical protein